MAAALARPHRARGSLSQKLVMETAIALFTERGYDRTSMNDIAAALGITKPALYYYFAGKEEIFVAAIAGASARIDAALVEASFDTKSTQDRIGVFIRCYSEALADPLFRGLALADERVLSEGAVEATRRGKRRSLKRLGGFLQDAGIPPSESRSLALATFGALNWSAATFGERSGTELRDVTRMMIDLVYEKLKNVASHGLGRMENE